MASTTTEEAISRWPDLPGDVLSSIADRLDPKIGFLRLRSTCNSWRSSLSSLNPSIHFPLKLPIPPLFHDHASISLYPTHLSLSLRSIYLLSPSSSSSSSSNNGGFLIKVEERDNSRTNTFTLIDPLSSNTTLPQPIHPINLLDYRITHVSDSYFVKSDSESLPFPITKVAVATNFFKDGDFVVLGLRDSWDLFIWRLGDENWVEIVANGRCFSDIISYNGKFYATADTKGRLVMIDYRLKPIDLVSRLMYGNGFSAYLLECDACLYLVDKGGVGVALAVRADEEGFKFGVFKLDEKGHFWDYEIDLNDSVFFIGEDANFSLSRKVYNGCVRNVIYFKELFFDNDIIDGVTKVFDTKTGTTSWMEHSQSYLNLYCPPSSGCATAIAYSTS